MFTSQKRITRTILVSSALTLLILMMSLALWRAHNAAAAAPVQRAVEGDRRDGWAMGAPGNKAGSALLATAVPISPAAAQNCVVPPAGLVSWWPGDGSANDIVGGNAGSLQDGATFGTGEVEQAFSFNGTTAYFQAPTNGLPTGNSNRTLELWVKINSFPAGEAFLAGYGSFGASTATYQLGTSGSTLFFSQWGDGISGPSLQTGVWYHVAVTNVGNSITLYLNGAPVSSGAKTINTTSGTQFYMGRIPGPLGDTRKLDGLVDEVGFYTRALSASEIQAIFNAGSAGKCKIPCATPSFSAATDFGAGNIPVSIAKGDFNGDGKLDLATANHTNPGSVTVLKGNGDGIFTFASSPSTGAIPYSVAAGDFNGDGKLDLATANYGGHNVTILLGNGDGTFNPTSVNSNTFSACRAIAVGDFNGDGKLDLAVTNGNTDTVTILAGNGDGTFTTASNYPTGRAPLHVAVGDFNNDAKLDLAIVNYFPNSVTILLGLGDGNFTPMPSLSTINPGYVVVGDFDQDGKLDLATASANVVPPNKVVTILKGNGGGTFTFAGSYAAGGDSYSLAVADFNHDNRLDLAVANYHSSNVTILMGNGDATFTFASNLSTGPLPASVAAGDFNLDGKLDLAVAIQDAATVSIFLNNCAPANTAPTISATGITPQQGSAATNSQIATVSDADQAADTLTVTAAPATGSGVTVSNITINAAGQVFADVVAGCAATNSTFTLTVTDNQSATATATLTVNVTTNTPPTLTYGTQQVAAGGSLTINPATGSSDNGSVSTIAVQSQGTYTGTLSVNSSGVVSISNATPPGTHTITIRATDNCGGVGGTTGASFTLTVACANNPIVSNNADSGVGSLRQAILDACIGSTITFAGGVTSPITLTSGKLTIDKNLTINGAGAASTIIDGGGSDRVFEVRPGATVQIDAVTVRNGNPGTGGFCDCSGGGIYNNQGKMTLTNSTVTGNRAAAGGGIYNRSGTVVISRSTISNNTTSFYGGGIWNDGGVAVLTLTDSTIRDNSSRLRGGGIYNLVGTATLINSTVSGNTSPPGGGIFNHLADSKLTLINSTVSGNTAKRNSSTLASAGGGILNDGAITLVNSTVAGNMDINGPGGGIYNRGSTASLKNTIVANNTKGAINNSSPADCSGAITSQGYNLIGNNSGAIISTQPTDQIGTNVNPINPLLGPLANNGGPTQTHALLFNSPALDKGSAAVGVTTDQRGLLRPVDLSSIANAAGGNGSDIGAFETQTVSTPTGTNVTVQSGGVTLTFPTVSTAGVTTVMPINPSSAGTLPGGYQLGDLAFEISTTASVTPPITVCFNVPTVTNPTTFANLRILHNEGGTLVDRTILSGPNAPNFVTKTICASVNSLSPFVIGQLLDHPPTISNASANPFLLLPPNHNLVDVMVNYNTTVYWGPATCSLNVTSNEPDEGLDADDMPDDIVVVSPSLVRLRAERASDGHGRVYTITVTCTDSLDQSASQSVNVQVNDLPAIAGQTITRQQGLAGTPATIATVSDDLTPAGNLSVMVTSVPVGITIGPLTNNNGTITANVAAACNAALGNNTVGLKVTDGSGLTRTANLTVNVTANAPPAVTITGPASGAVYPVGTTMSFTGSFIDDGGTHTAKWILDGTPMAGTVNENTSEVSLNRTFTEAGVYLVTLAVTDSCATGTANTIGGLTAMVVIYDPNGGFVTGGGWINSPAGAYRPNPLLTGKASFGFVSKYKPGATTPTGNTEFQFHQAGFNFRSASYDWLVVAGARAQYKGVGTVNGSGNYGFLLTAIDGQLTGGGGTDKFRIKIWDKNKGDAIVYDNQVSGDTSDGATPNTAIGGGSIVIHK